MNTTYFRDKTGRFTSFTPKTIRNNCLYKLKDSNTIVRVKKQNKNGTIFVSWHKKLFGIIYPQDLRLATKDEVNSYLEAVE